MRDEIESINEPKTKQKTYILNTGTSDSNGEHWVVLIINPVNKHLFYYDSFAGEPMTEVMKLQKKFGPGWRLYYNTDVNQYKASVSCGYIALMIAEMSQWYNLTPDNFDKMIRKLFTRRPSEKNHNRILQYILSRDFVSDD